MAGISDQAALKPENFFKYNGIELNHKEFSDGSGLELYDAHYRMYDPQLGRFISIDPLSEKFVNWSPYAFAFDNPISLNDPNGDIPPTIKQIIIYGYNHSPTFKKLLSDNSINVNNYENTISFGSNTETIIETGKITLTKGSDIKSQTVHLAHELTNRNNLKTIHVLNTLVSKGKITPKTYAERLAHLEVPGEINQIKVAAEIGYRYKGEEYKSLNAVIDEYAKGKLTNKDLQGMVVPTKEHLSEYETQGAELRTQTEERIKSSNN
jgi:RHS repeat-associated protein